ncbi:hypothetical protein BDF14DRAFT_1882441 [Spinellus fusiger]|nr:hypothetical protein BDF14DRAFT_1882441 [Spinellus fusiger]
MQMADNCSPRHKWRTLPTHDLCSAMDVMPAVGEQPNPMQVAACSLSPPDWPMLGDSLIHSPAYEQDVGSFLQQQVAVPFDNVNIKYFGRWRTSTTSIQSGWPGAYFKTIVHGPRITLRLRQPSQVYVRIDNRKPVEYRTSDTEHTLEMVISPADLEQGPHSLSVAASTNASIDLEAILLQDSRGTAPVDVSSSMIEFVGHDLTLGTHTSQSILTSFAWAVSEMLGTEHAQIAFPEARLMDHHGVSGMASRYFEWSSSATQQQHHHPQQQQAGIQWDFSSYIPAAIVILLGRNDRDAHNYAQCLEHFLLQMRSHVGLLPIFVLSEPLGNMTGQSQMAIQRRNDQGDQNVYFVDTTYWLRYGPTAFIDVDLVPLFFIFPHTQQQQQQQQQKENLNDAGHETMARKLAPLLQAKLSHPQQPLPGPLPNPNLPYDWQTMDVGEEMSIGLPGSVSFDSGNTFTLWGSGADISTTKDAFRFVYQSLSGQGTLEATVASQSAFATCAKAGIMLREHLALGSPFVMLGISPAEGLFLQTRRENMQQAQWIKKTRALPPYRLRLVRKDALFIAQSQRIGGSEWDTLGNVTVPFIARDMYAGLAVTSCDTAVVSVAKFVNVTLQGGVRGGSTLLRMMYQP